MTNKDGFLLRIRGSRFGQLMIFANELCLDHWSQFGSKCKADLGADLLKLNKARANAQASLSRVRARWSNPTVGWCRLNTDGAVHKRTQLASCGGVIRNSDGLLTTWSMGISYLVMETDCLEAYHLLQPSTVTYGCFTLLPHIAELLARPWTILVSHVVRERNTLVDTMAKMEVDEDFICHRFIRPLACYLQCLRSEAVMAEGG
ncbi:hypothetical protein V6N12_050908 [Hibiscus sabdariffa]|uniref:RNase H type-1 domain-containing protein n=1 Tax=Hibiscus sabdariffa TaxID=183260 RepID=A0ABR2GDS9_9ROSI